jgi:hypothetical protein
LPAAQLTAVARDGPRLVWGGAAGEVVVHDLGDGDRGSVASIGSGVAALDLWGGVLVVAGEDGRLWRDTEDGLKQFGQSSSEVGFLRLLADGSVFVGTPQACRVFSASGSEHRLTGDAIHGFAVSADRRLVAWGEEDGTVALLEVTGGALSRAGLHRDRVTALAFLGEDLVSASQDGTVCLAQRQGELRRTSAARTSGAVTALAAAPPHVVVGLSSGEVVALRGNGPCAG